MADRKTVLVTGASRGIGKAIAIRYAQMGYNLAITCIHRQEQLMQTMLEIEDYQVECMTFVGDAGDYESCRKLFERIHDTYGHLDVLVNNAGIAYLGLIQDMSPEEWDHLIRTNLTSVFNCCRLAVPEMIRRKQGKIINISSVWGSVGASCEAAYSAAKGGINGFTRALAKELAPSNIQVNAIACGAIDTEMNGHLSAEEKRELEEEIPLGRMGGAAEVADTVFFLCGEEAGYITGQVIPVNGGWSP